MYLRNKKTVLIFLAASITVTSNIHTVFISGVLSVNTHYYSNMKYVSKNSSNYWFPITVSISNSCKTSYWENSSSKSVSHDFWDLRWVLVFLFGLLYSKYKTVFSHQAYLTPKSFVIPTNINTISTGRLIQIYVVMWIHTGDWHALPYINMYRITVWDRTYKENYSMRTEL